MGKWAKNSVKSTLKLNAQFGNDGNLLLRIFYKNFVKAMLLLKKLLKITKELISRKKSLVRENFAIFHTME